MSGAVPQVPAHGGEFAAVGGERVAGPASYEHHGVAYAGGQDPGLVQYGRVLRAHQVGRVRCGQGLAGAGRAEARLAPAVPELEELDGPFDIGQPAASELGVEGRVGAAWHALRLHTGLQAPDLAYGVVAESVRRIAERIDEVDETAAQLIVPGDGFGAQQGLRLPSQGPAAVVGLVRLQRPYEGPGLALGPEVRVDEEGRVGARDLEQAAHLGDDRVRGAGRLLFVGALLGSCTNRTSASEP